MAKRKLSRRNFLHTAALATTGALAAACAPKTVEVEREVTTVVEKEVTKVVVKEPITLRFHGWLGTEGDMLDDWAGEFNEKHHPDVFLKTEHFPGPEYQDKIMTLIAGGTLGDGFWNTNITIFPRLAASGVYMSLDPIVDQVGFDLDTYYPNTLDSCRFDGELYSLPWGNHPGWVGVYYNKAMFDDAGLDYPADDWTYDDLLEASKVIAKPDEGVFAWNPTRSYYGIETMGRAFGGDIVSEDGSKCQLDDEPIRAALQFMTDASYKHRIAPRPQDVVGGQNGMFASNMLAMFFGGFWNKSIEDAMQVKDGWGITFAPLGPANNRGAIVYISQLGLNAETKYPLEMFDYIAHVCSAEASVTQYNVYGYPSPHPEVAAREEFQDIPHYQVYNGEMAVAQNPHLAANHRHLEFMRAVASPLELLWTGEQEVEAAIDGAKKAGQAILDKEPIRLGET